MKKIFFRAGATVLLTALVAGCAKETIETPDNGDRKIVYKAAFGANRPDGGTRAAEIDDEGLRSGGAQLPVWAWFNGGTSVGNLFGNWSLTYLATPVGHWSYNNDVDVIHPADALTHFSVWPTKNVATASRDADDNILLDNVDVAGGDARFDYTVPALASDQEDLLVARANTTYNNPAATMVYAHALSQINFSVKGYAGVKITISDIKMGGLHDKATYSFGAGAWSDHGGSAAYGYQIVPELAGGPVGQTSGLDDREVFFGNHDAGDDAGKDVGHDNSLMLLPQDFAQNTGAWFSFDYVLTNMDGVVLKSGSDVEVPLKDLQATAWEKGKRYRYTIRFNELNMISYNVAVSAWEKDNQSPAAQ
jgi:hypothetical protein